MVNDGFRLFIIKAVKRKSSYGTPSEYDEFVKNIIDISSLNVTLGSTQVLADLSLQIPAGQWCSLVGPSGCGKSTLLRAVAGLVPSQSERFITSFDTPAFVFQDATLMPWRNVHDNVRLPLELRDPAGGASSNTIKETIRQVGLAEGDLEKFPRELSGGMRMRVSMARALVNNPDMMFMDEPFAALDELLRHQLNQLIYEIWRQQQVTMMFVTHNVSEAVYLSDRILIMNRYGNITQDVSIELPDQRNPELRASSDYLQIVAEISSYLQEAMG